MWVNILNFCFISYSFKQLAKAIQNKFIWVICSPKRVQIIDNEINIFEPDDPEVTGIAEIVVSE
jgi:hypothetical protein